MAKGRIQVKYELSGAVAHVKANKVDIMWSSAAYAEPKAPRTRPRTRLWHAPTTILAVHSTACFRRLARLEVRPGDRCVEIGCSFGQCTRVRFVGFFALLAVYCMQCIVVYSNMRRVHTVGRWCALLAAYCICCSGVYTRSCGVHTNLYRVWQC